MHTSTQTQTRTNTVRTHTKTEQSVLLDIIEDGRGEKYISGPFSVSIKQSPKTTHGSQNIKSENKFIMSLIEARAEISPSTWSTLEVRIYHSASSTYSTDRVWDKL